MQRTVHLVVIGHEGSEEISAHDAREGALAYLVGRAELYIAQAQDRLGRFTRAVSEADLYALRDKGAPHGVRLAAATAICQRLAGVGARILERTVAGEDEMQREANRLAAFVGYLTGWGFALIDDLRFDLNDPHDAVATIREYVERCHGWQGPQVAVDDQESVDNFSAGDTMGKAERERYDTNQ